jgi:hypothetical protein
LALSRADCEGRGTSGRDSSTPPSVAERRASRLTRVRTWDFAWGMPSHARIGLVFGSVVAALAGCKEQGDATRPLPAPEPPATAAQAPPRDDVAPPKKRPVDDGEPRAPKRPGDDDAPKTATPPASPDAPSVPGTATAADGTAGTPATAPSVPPVTAPSAACLSRCQSALQGCLAQPVDGGVPGFGNLDLCKKAFEACQSACK